MHAPAGRPRLVRGPEARTPYESGKSVGFNPIDTVYFPRLTTKKLWPKDAPLDRDRRRCQTPSIESLPKQEMVARAMGGRVEMGAKGKRNSCSCICLPGAGEGSASGVAVTRTGRRCGRCRTGEGRHSLRATPCTPRGESCPTCGTCGRVAASGRLLSASRAVAIASASAWSTFPSRGTTFTSWSRRRTRGHSLAACRGSACASRRR